MTLSRRSMIGASASVAAVAAAGPALRAVAPAVRKRDARVAAGWSDVQVIGVSSMALAVDNLTGSTDLWTLSQTRAGSFIRSSKFATLPSDFVPIGIQGDLVYGGLWYDWGSASVEDSLAVGSTVETDSVDDFPAPGGTSTVVTRWIKPCAYRVSGSTLVAQTVASTPASRLSLISSSNQQLSKFVVSHAQNDNNLSYSDAATLRDTSANSSQVLVSALAEAAFYDLPVTSGTGNVAFRQDASGGAASAVATVVPITNAAVQPPLPNASLLAINSLWGYTYALALDSYGATCFWDGQAGAWSSNWIGPDIATNRIFAVTDAVWGWPWGFVEENVMILLGVNGERSDGM